MKQGEAGGTGILAAEGWRGRLQGLRRLHFVGIGGIGMSGIARVLLQMGLEVSGSDLRTSGITRGLEELGARFHLGHDAAHVEGAEVVVVSSAVPAENPELQAARARGIRVLQRGQMLSLLMEDRIGIAVAGTHGKTTTTSMAAMVLEQAGLEPTVIIGGELRDLGSNAKLGQGVHLVAEADESDASFVDLHPRIAVVTSADADVNLSTSPFAGCGYDYEATLEVVKGHFVEFMHRVPEGGLLILCHDHPQVRTLLDRVERPYLSYGLEPGAELTALEIKFHGYGSRSRVFLRGEELGEMVLRVPGRHNVQNALAAVAVGLEVGLGFSQVASILARFGGVHRRFQVLGTWRGITVVDDYAHNPSKVRAAVHAARSGGAARVVAVFQPHRFTRTRLLADQFAGAFEEADVLLVTDVYSAGEAPIEGAGADCILEGARRHGAPREIFHAPGRVEVIELLLRVCREGDVVLALGAGDVGQWARALGEALASDGEGPEPSARQPWIG